jgi:hypothetical protein
LLNGFRPLAPEQLTQSPSPEQSQYSSSDSNTTSATSTSTSTTSAPTTTGIVTQKETLPTGQVLTVHHHPPHTVKQYSKDDENFVYKMKLGCIMLCCIGLLCLCWVVHRRGDNVDPRLPASEGKDSKT